MKHSFPVGLLCLLSVLSVHAQKAPSKRASSAVQTQYAWTAEAWTADEKPFQTTRVALVMAQQQHKNMLALAKQYGAAAKKKPNDALEVFRWGYAAWLACDFGTNRVANVELFDANNALTKTPSPHSYQYDRLRYLIEACNFSGYGIESLGDRLLKREPYDYYVIYYQIGLLGGSLSKTKNAHALELCKMLMEKDPKNATGYERAGKTYQNRWWVSKKKSDAQAAIDYYRKGKALLPANNRNQAVYDEEIGFIEQEMKHAH